MKSYSTINTLPSSPVHPCNFLKKEYYSSKGAINWEKIPSTFFCFTGFDEQRTIEELGRHTDGQTHGQGNWFHPFHSPWVRSLNWIGVAKVEILLQLSSESDKFEGMETSDWRVTAELSSKPKCQESLRFKSDSIRAHITKSNRGKHQKKLARFFYASFRQLGQKGYKRIYFKFSLYIYDIGWKRNSLSHFWRKKSSWSGLRYRWGGLVWVWLYLGNKLEGFFFPSEFQKKNLKGPLRSRFFSSSFFVDSLSN